MGVQLDKEYCTVKTIAANITYPSCIAIDSKNNVALTDSEKHCVRRYVTAGSASSSIYSTPSNPSLNTSLSSSTPTLLSSSGNGQVSSANPSSPKGTEGPTSPPSPESSLVTSASSPSLPVYEPEKLKLNWPSGLAIALDGSIYVSDTQNNRVCLLSKSQPEVTICDKFSKPHSIAIDMSGNIFVADTFNHRICKISAIDRELTVIGGGDMAGFKDGKESLFYRPRGIAVDSNKGTVYIADTFNNSIRKILPSGETITIAGDGRQGTKDGLGKEANFNYPESVSLDVFGNIYVADTYNHLIRKVTPEGLVSTIAGDGTVGSKNHGGDALLAQFHYPTSVAVDLGGNLFVADSFNHSVRKIIRAVPLIPPPPPPPKVRLITPSMSIDSEGVPLSSATSASGPPLFHMEVELVVPYVYVANELKIRESTTKDFEVFKPVLGTTFRTPVNPCKDYEVVTSWYSCSTIGQPSEVVRLNSVVSQVECVAETCIVGKPSKLHLTLKNEEGATLSPQLTQEGVELSITRLQGGVKTIEKVLVKGSVHCYEYISNEYDPIVIEVGHYERLKVFLNVVPRGEVTNKLDWDIKSDSISVDNSAVEAIATGRMLTKFQQYYLLGESNIGKTFLVSHSETLSVLKQMSPPATPPSSATSSSGTTAGTLDGFFTKKEAFELLKHPNIVEIIGASRSDCFYLRPFVLDTLDSVIGEYERGDSRIGDWGYRYACDISKGLAYLHCSSMVHSRMKTKNCLITEENHAKLSDYGLFHSEPSPQDMWPAPELLLSAPPTPATDIYAFGILLWQIVNKSHLPPYDPSKSIPQKEVLQPEGEEPNEEGASKVLEENNQDQLPEILPISPLCSSDIADLMKKCWQVYPLLRPSIGDVMIVLAKSPWKSLTTNPSK